MRLVVVILNYRTPNLIADCLKSLQNQIDPVYDAVVVYNASGDRSVEQIQQAIKEND